MPLSLKYNLAGSLGPIVGELGAAIRSYMKGAIVSGTP